MKKYSFKLKNLLFAGVVLLLLLTNPTQEQYYKWVHDQIKDNRDLPKPSPILLGMGEYPKTRISNCKLFSIYETYFDGTDKIIIGIGGNFFTIYSKGLK
ncbi:MAG: hypothetical protein H6Q67_2003 [Firmicutes bacterium]|nr:hypothetical protein [Bacillota bacterium]